MLATYFGKRIYFMHANTGHVHQGRCLAPPMSAPVRFRIISTLAHTSRLLKRKTFMTVQITG
eukprot:1050618-Pelagomonas_calceolata.AAC.1